MPVDVLILGGGLAGIIAAVRLLREGKSVTLVDSSLPEAQGKLGGFAKFSGAKFSLPPAGMGLTALLGSTEYLFLKIEEIIEILGIVGCEQHFSIDRNAIQNKSLEIDTTLRAYKSIVLTPMEIDDLIARLTTIIDKDCNLLDGKVIEISYANDHWNSIVVEAGCNEPTIVTAKAIFYAAGRLATGILTDAGAAKYPGKGLDVGVRIEFLEKIAVKNLRSLGPDAKIIRGNCRTFCLNSPGVIYYYQYKNIKIPGGIVAKETEQRANFGILVRVADKENGINRILDRYDLNKNEIKTYQEMLQVGFPEFTKIKCLNELFGKEVVNELQQFCEVLGHLELVDWRQPYKIHIPLIDWYWETFCDSFSHKTSLKNVYALGDSAGHARGLLQAALSGWIASEEYLDDIAN